METPEFDFGDVNPFDKKEIYRKYRTIVDTPYDFVEFADGSLQYFEESEIVYVSSTGKFGICIPALFADM